MALVEVEVVCRQSSQRAFDAVKEVFSRKPAIVGIFRHWEERLGREDEVVTGEIRDREPQRLLGLAFGVDIRGVKEVDPEFKSAANQRGARVAIDGGPQREPRAQTNCADAKTTIPKPAIVHGRRIPEPKFPNIGSC